jgi:hypothetical protein
LILLHNPFCFGLLLGIRLLLYARPDATPSTAYRLVAALQDVLYDLTFFMSSWPLKLTSGFAGHDPNIVRTTPFCYSESKTNGDDFLCCHSGDSFGLPQESPKKSKLRQEVGR